MAIFTFLQNNSGGVYLEDMPVKLTIEARDADEANEKAVAFGVYFDGVESGEDCDCCGDRWTRAYRAD